MENKVTKGEEMPKIQKSKSDEIFTLVKSKDGVRIAIGNFQISKKKFKNFKDADFYLNQKPWEVLINVASLIADQTTKMQNNEKNKEQTE